MRVQSSEFRAGSEKMRCGARAKIALAKDRAFVWLISDQQRNRTKQSDKQPYVYTHPSNCDRDPPWEFLFYKTGVKVVAAL